LAALFYRKKLIGAAVAGERPGLPDFTLLIWPRISPPPHFLVFSCTKFGYIGREAISANAPILLKLPPPVALARLPRRGVGIFRKLP
jgi:hypothetical protein